MTTCKKCGRRIKEVFKNKDTGYTVFIHTELDMKDTGCIDAEPSEEEEKG